MNTVPMNKVLRSVLVVALLALPALLLPLGLQWQNYKPATQIVVIPHPDDEWQTWSLVENNPDTYKIFLLATHGEQTAFCPQRWTPQCSQARLSGIVSYLTNMAKTDATIPGDLEDLGQRGPFPTQGVTLQRLDDEGLPSQHVVGGRNSAQVFRDRAGRGALIVFDLGDGDLGVDELQWAIKTVIANPTRLGLPKWVMPPPRTKEGDPTSRLSIVSSYYNADFPTCFHYPHRDHHAVAQAVKTGTYPVAWKAGATCTDDPAVRVKKTVSATSVHAAWQGWGKLRLGARNGRPQAGVAVPPAFLDAYGWLGNYHCCDATQQALFMGPQAFWVMGRLP